MKTKTYDNEFLFNLGIQIKKKREQKKLTQEQLARKIKVKKSSITRIELGSVNTSICMLYAISKALEIELKDLVNFKI